MRSGTKVKGLTLDKRLTLDKNPDSLAVVTEGKTRYVVTDAIRLVEAVVRINR